MSRFRLLWMLTFASLLAFSCSCPAQSSIRFRLQDNLVRVPIVLNGHHVEAVLDSGTGGVGIDRAFATALGLKIGPSTGMVPGGGAPEPMYPVVISQLRFGPEHLTHVSAVALNLSHLSSSAGFPVKVLIGRQAFEKRPLRVDYPARKITFLPEGSQPACANPIPFTLFGGAPLVAATVQAFAGGKPHKLHLIVDLGTRHYAVMLGESFLDSAEGQKMQKAGHTTQVGTGTGGNIMGTTASIAGLMLDSQRFSHLTVALTSHVGAFNMGEADGSLGVPLWKAGSVIFDYPHKMLCFELPPDLQSGGR
jgi:hypothetical protein